MSSSQLTNSYFSEVAQPPTRYCGNIQIDMIRATLINDDFMVMIWGHGHFGMSGPDVEIERSFGDRLAD